MVYFAGIYKSANHKLPWYGYERRVLRHAIEIGPPKIFNKAGFEKLDREFAWWFAWFCGLLKHSGIDVRNPSKIIMLEYPDACPRCFRQKCDAGVECAKQTRDRVRANREGKKLLDRLPSNYGLSLQAIANHANSIYPHNLDTDLGSLAHRFQLEVNELSKAIDYWRDNRDRNKGRAKDKIHEELPDVLLWFASTWHRANTMERPGGPKYHTLDEILWSMFENGCPRCSPGSGQRTCTLCLQGTSDAEMYHDDLVFSADITYY